ncbi:hypothetical protein DRW03_29345 [Corallococcus sp. H22C18031201]|uniref:hypothetical protein n=1 Tax=Citreicoccus inhibens TaxID=2849499 RepID=UPI000E70A275|nr:hypothetical protein [Citreicoccus inhibens]MBU8897442.1 hypothetical protein [Citreicoccus inhibens]RJS16780.1 hypothetical protein DRW03_29345 [Corallococcus sp. H22C18031201]
MSSSRRRSQGLTAGLLLWGLFAFPVPGGAASDAPRPSSSGQACGGFAGAPCPQGYHCADAPSDDCDPARGGADCAGVCAPGGAPAKKPACEGAKSSGKEATGGSGAATAACPQGCPHCRARDSAPPNP